MAVYKKTQVVGIVVLILAGGLGILMLWRPEWVDLTKMERGIATVKGLVTGDKVTVGSAAPGGKKDEPPEKKDIYRLDLKTGGRVYTDNLRQSDGSFTYTTASGMEVNIPGHEVVGLVRYKEGEEPQE